MPITTVIYIVFAIGICMLVGMVPLLVCLVLGFDAVGWVDVLLCAVFSAPAISAAAAMYRDHPALNLGNVARSWSQGVAEDKDSDHDRGEHERGPTFPDWIARPYVGPDDDTKVFRAFAAAYAKLFVRSLTAAAIYGVVEFFLLWDAQLLSGGQYAALILPICVIGSTVVVNALLSTLVLAVEFPRAKLLARLRNGLVLCAAGWWWTLLDCAVLALYLWGVTYQPVFVTMLGTGLFGYFVLSNVRRQAAPLFRRMAVTTHGDADHRR